MPEIYLQHPQHGQKVCHSVSEAQADVANGWEEYDPAPSAQPVVVEPESVAVVDSAQVVAEPEVVVESVKQPAPAAPVVIPSFLAAPEDPPVKVKKPKG